MRVLFHYEAGNWLQKELASFGELGLHVDVVPVADRQRFEELLPKCDVIWHVLDPLRTETIKLARNLRLIQKIGVGVNTIDLEAAKARDIAVCNMPGTNTRAVAEMALLLMLSALRRLSHLDTMTRRGDGWAISPDLQASLGEVHGKTVGFFGYGGVPQTLAPILSAMGAKLLYTATRPKEDAQAEWCTFDELVQKSDIVSLHAPLTEATSGIFDRKTIASMKKGAVLVNTARGELVDQKALAEALHSGHLGAAGLDVFVPEPVDPRDSIFALENVVVAPHLAWLTSETLQRSLKICVENCQRLMRDEELLHRVC